MADGQRLCYIQLFPIQTQETLARNPSIRSNDTSRQTPNPASRQERSTDPGSRPGICWLEWTLRPNRFGRGAPQVLGRRV